VCYEMTKKVEQNLYHGQADREANQLAKKDVVSMEKPERV
jgi:hypothetical protein